MPFHRLAQYRPSGGGGGAGAVQGELHTAEKEEPGDRDKGEALKGDHQAVLPAAVVQHSDGVPGAVAPQDHEAEEQVQRGEFLPPFLDGHGPSLLSRESSVSNPLGLKGFERFPFWSVLERAK